MGTYDYDDRYEDEEDDKDLDLFEIPDPPRPTSKAPPVIPPQAPPVPHVGGSTDEWDWIDPEADDNYESVRASDPLPSIRSLGRDLDALFDEIIPWHTEDHDNMEVLRKVPDNTMDSVVTDPPYGLSDHTPQDVQGALQAWLKGERFTLNKGGFSEAMWDSFVPGPEIWKEILRVLKPGGHLLVFAGTRTLDLMGLAIRIAGFEFRDTIACDGVLRWTYAQGAPKGVDLSKEIDAQVEGLKQWDAIQDHIRHWRDARGLSNTQVHDALGLRSTGSGMMGHWLAKHSQRSIPSKEQWKALKGVLHWPDCDLDIMYDSLKDGASRPVVGHRVVQDNNGKGPYFSDHDQDPDTPRKTKIIDITTSATPEAQRWEGWGTSLKPSWEPVLVFRKPIGEKTVASNVLKWGTGGMNIDGSRVACEGGTPTIQRRHFAPTVGPPTGTGWRCAQRSTYQDVRPGEILGRWPANTVLTHLPGCVTVGARTITGNGRQGISRGDNGRKDRSAWRFSPTETPKVCYTDEGGRETVSDWECQEGCPVAILDQQNGLSQTTSGTVTPSGNSNRLSMNMAEDGSFKEPQPFQCMGDSGGASRFFPTLAWEGAEINGVLHCSKVSSSERRTGMQNGRVNNHPTLKPIRLMRWLINLVTPPGGLVMDPFMGSGSTGVAAVTDGFRFLGIEQSPQFAAIARDRITHAARRDPISTPSIPEAPPEEAPAVTDLGSLFQL